MELVAFAEAAKVRRYAQVVLATPRQDKAALPPPPDVPRYWLGPAALALQAMAVGEDAAEHTTVALIRERDRAATFLCLVVPALGQGEVAVEWLPDALGELESGTPVTAVQRRLWSIAAHDGYGSAGREAVVRWLRQAIPETLPGGWLDALAPPAGSASLLGNSPDMARQLQAAAQLSTLRQTCERLAAPYDVVADADAAGVRVQLGLLVLEGSPPERDLISRARELRQIIAPEDGEPEAEAGADQDVHELILDDLTGEDPALAALAFRAAAPAIEQRVDALVVAASGPPVQEVTTRVGADSITLRADGPSPTSMAAAERRIAESSPVRKGSRVQPYVLLAVGAVGLVLFLVHWFFVVIGLILAGWGAASLLSQIRSDQRAAMDAATRITERQAELRTRVERLAEEVAAYSAGAADRAATAASDRVAIRQAIAKPA